MRYSLPCRYERCEDCYTVGCQHDCHSDPKELGRNLQKSLYWADALEAIGENPRAA